MRIGDRGRRAISSDPAGMLCRYLNLGTFRGALDLRQQPLSEPPIARCCPTRCMQARSPLLPPRRTPKAVCKLMPKPTQPMAITSSLCSALPTPRREHLELPSRLSLAKVGSRDDKSVAQVGSPLLHGLRRQHCIYAGGSPFTISTKPRYTHPASAESQSITQQ